MLRSIRARRGFTLAEVIVSVALVAALAAITIPAVRGRLQDSYEDAIITEFSNLASAINAYKQDVGKYPLRLDYLYVLPGTPKDRCTNNLTATQIANWRGPYISRVMQTGTAAYVVAGKDTLFTTITGVTGGMKYKLVGTDSLTAVNVDTKVDGTVDKLNGSILWNTYGSPAQYYIEYVVAAKTSAC